MNVPVVRRLEDGRSAGQEEVLDRLMRVGQENDRGAYKVAKVPHRKKWGCTTVICRKVLDRKVAGCRTGKLQRYHSKR